jgi:exodeoxyribonuclease VII small subunit
MKTDMTYRQAMEKLEKINEWFASPDIDLEEGLTKLKEGKELLQFCRERLAAVENQFQEIKVELEDEGSTEIE